MIRRSTLGIAWLALAVAACYPERSVDSTSEFATVTTSFDEQADFATVTKYALPDTVLYVPREEDKEVPAATQSAVLAQIRTNLNALGWQEVTNPKTTPVDVYATAIITTTLNIYYGWAYWDYWYWYGGWPPGWGGGYGWYYPPSFYTYSYTTGTLLMNLIDARPAAAQPQLVPIVWTGAVNGVLENQATNVAIVTAGIDQAFKQSPYLGAPQ
jgi:Domain of unknown function (DUF4136)